MKAILRHSKGRHAGQPAGDAVKPAGDVHPPHRPRHGGGSTSTGWAWPSRMMPPPLPPWKLP